MFGVRVAFVVSVSGAGMLATSADLEVEVHCYQLARGVETDPMCFARGQDTWVAVEPDCWFERKIRDMERSGAQPIEAWGEDACEQGPSDLPKWLEVYCWEVPDMMSNQSTTKCFGHADDVWAPMIPGCEIDEMLRNSATETENWIDTCRTSAVGANWDDVRCIHTTGMPASGTCYGRRGDAWIAIRPDCAVDSMLDGSSGFERFVEVEAWPYPGCRTRE